MGSKIGTGSRASSRQGRDDMSSTNLKRGTIGGGNKFDNSFSARQSEAGGLN